jgi:Family of unknown function (DUF6010)
MVRIPVRCPYGQMDHVIKGGKTRTEKQRYRCQNADCSHASFVLNPAYQGLNAYGFIGLGWLLHTGWDIMHHLYGTPIVPFVPTSSLGCAICDPMIAAWCFAGAPSVYGLATKQKRTQ